jgi:hypothetical protein
MFSKEAVITNMKKTEQTESSPEEDDAADFGRYSPEHEPNNDPSSSNW